MFNSKVFVAELVGTFTLVFVGAAAGIYAQNIGLLGLALAQGLTLAVVMSVFGYISGAHVNPAVTLGLALNGTIKWIETVVYWIAQLAGAVLAILLLRTFLSPLSADAISSTATSGLLGADYVYYALGLEAFLTFLLVSTYLHTAVGEKAGPFAGWAVGATLVIAVMAGGPLTGASLNPARSFGPAIFTSAVTAGTPDYQNPMFYLMYFVGPFMGSLLAVALYQFFTYERVNMEDFEIEDDDEDEQEVEVKEPVVEEPVKKPARKPAVRKTTTRKAAKK